MRRIVYKISLFLLFAALSLIIFIGFQIYSYGAQKSEIETADAAIVLGAAVWSDELSPVFKERVNHAVELYRAGKIRKIIFTGGQGNAHESSESAAARNYAAQNGIPLEDILIEEFSHNTYENILYAKQIADAENLKTFFIVSDPLHLKRAVLMAQDASMQAFPSPTLTTRYQGWQSQTKFLAHEVYYYIGYLINRPFLET